MKYIPAIAFSIFSLVMNVPVFLGFLLYSAWHWNIKPLNTYWEQWTDAFDESIKALD